MIKEIEKRKRLKLIEYEKRFNSNEIDILDIFIETFLLFGVFRIYFPDRLTTEVYLNRYKHKPTIVINHHNLNTACHSKFIQEYHCIDFIG